MVLIHTVQYSIVITNQLGSCMQNLVRMWHTMKYQRQQKVAILNLMQKWLAWVDNWTAVCTSFFSYSTSFFSYSTLFFCYSTFRPHFSVIPPQNLDYSIIAKFALKSKKTLFHMIICPTKGNKADTPRAQFRNVTDFLAFILLGYTWRHRFQWGSTLNRVTVVISN